MPDAAKQASRSSTVPKRFNLDSTVKVLLSIVLPAHTGLMRGFFD